MARITKGILGGFTGKVGTVIGYNWRGQDIMRSLPRKSRREPSQLQLEQREKFAASMFFLNPLRPFLDLYFQKSHGLKSRFNQAMSYTMQQAVVPDGGGGFVMDYSKALISTGHLRQLEGATAIPKAGTVLEFSWINNSGQGNATSTDQLIGVCYSPELDTYHLFERIADREDVTTDLSLPPEFSGKDVHVWASLVSFSGKRAASSSYLGLVTLT